MICRLPTVEPTALQESLKAIYDAMLDAREACSDDEYQAFVLIVEERIIIESIRLSRGEAVRALRAAA